MFRVKDKNKSVIWKKFDNRREKIRKIQHLNADCEIYNNILLSLGTSKRKSDENISPTPKRTQANEMDDLSDDPTEKTINTEGGTPSSDAPTPAV